MGLESRNLAGAHRPGTIGLRPQTTVEGAWMRGVKEQKHDREDLAKFKKLKIKFEAENLLKYWSRLCVRRPIEVVVLNCW
jgi:hypothetical protein